MHILGIGGSDHDFAAALLCDGVIRFAIEDERISRVKRGKGKWYKTPTSPSIEYCLKASGLTLDDISAVYANTHLERLALEQHLPNLTSISHHMAHAAYAFFSSPFENADIVVIDGAGSRISENVREVQLETVTLARGKNSSITIDATYSGKRSIPTCYWRYMTSNSLGSFYEAVTDAIGFNPYDAGKTMGLASYGSNRLYQEMKQFVSLKTEGTFLFDPYSGIFEWIDGLVQRNRNPFSIRADLAQAVQTIFEEALIHILNHFNRISNSTTLCYTGGCALNTVANSKIRSHTPYRQIFIPPASGDAGTAIGSALYGYFIDEKNKYTPSANSIQSIAYLGKDYSEEEILLALENFPVCYYKPVDMLSEVASRLYAGEVLGWHQGRSEIGPRALGNRSILASPKENRMRNYINLSVKKRETFRPFAPVVIEEDASRYFDIDGSSPFMLFVADVKKEFRNALAAITHVDGTARVQTLTKDSNPLLHDLLIEYKKLSGIPVLLNTSFNGPNQPIVESPAHAIAAFLDLDLHALVLGPYVVERYTANWPNKEPIS